ncbi:MAG: hypothetical protein A3G32_05240 [Deltaproteobacteria bacterium RIFCSPLOWO2_12_FULL_40_28]|nr:MAG: hypothetical protein A3C45_09350 [Deltaproteobacteria bacterium RIFCSPHIGHO2_02_FULL_40_28]OGQ19766.1 MAG: hypothetical protein A3E27_08545 [Deltaproteobacteria bacterium RIFCSPHIGHO2_12_FULL_40_32]OGQ41043.1 MAG: hypothetical protein A3I69_03960 [Deltaproteobacteria bacterium RIFCSPLOWO2_02_FULL_40_36]OGQ54159.1 MAG: hypothetical protein A3G32_05240 [Deltaproteobacteria bacterium RIFCSPLOWO2_12_FULL_40_28]
MTSYFFQFIDLVLHIDIYLNQWIALTGPWMYVFLFLVIFCETGLVVTPFLPGDSLLFAIGALSAASHSPLQIHSLIFLLTLAAIMGDSSNYWIGRFIGSKVFSKETRWIKKKYLFKTQNFYEKYGAKTIVLGRFLPIIRTFAPFVAGVGIMKYKLFLTFSVLGTIAWISLFLLAGYYFGNIPVVKNNFSIVIMAIIVISLLPAVIEILKTQRSK